MENTLKPALYIISTPIGNLGDITLRAIETLKRVDLIAAEDTRHAGILLKKHDIDAQLTSYHAHSGPVKIEKILETLKNGGSVAVISDAGTPGISDPAYQLIQEVLEEDIEVVPIPGPSAFLAALAGSGLHMHRFTFYGFLPLKKGRQSLIKSWHDKEETIIFYESPHRIQKTLFQLLELLGPSWKCVIARELTKIHEEFMRGSLEEINEQVQKRNPKGEYVVLLSKA